MTRVIIRPKRRMPRPNSVSGGRRASRWAMAPKAVSAPVRDDDRRADPGLNRRAQEDAVARVGDTVLSRGQVARRLLDGQGLTGERRLADVQVLDGQQTGIRRDEIARVELDDVPGNQVRDRQFLLAPIAQDGRRRGHLLADVVHGPARLELHEEVQQHAEQHHRDDDQAADRVAQRERDGAGHEEDDDEGIGEEAQEADQAGEARLLAPGCSGRGRAGVEPLLRRSARQAWRGAARATPREGGPRTRRSVALTPWLSSASSSARPTTTGDATAARRPALRSWRANGAPRRGSARYRTCASRSKTPSARRRPISRAAPRMATIQAAGVE